MNKLHYIHSRSGRIGGRADTTPADVDAIVDALRRDPRKHLVLHFHGGLVSKQAGLGIAERLLGVYSIDARTGGFPVFYVWESSAWETIRNNLVELADEPVFKQLLRKVLQYAVEQLGAQALHGARALPQASLGTRELEVKAELEKFWQAPGKQTIPFRGYDPMTSRAQARSASVSITEDEIQADLETDVEFQRALATLPDLPAGARSAFAGGIAAEHRSAFSEAASREFSRESRARGLVELYQVAKFLVRVLRGVLKRYSAARDHGLYATCVEELVRGFKVAGSGLNEWAQALQWNRMKKDTADAFGPNADVHAGTALLARLSSAIASGLDLQRITLVGHSTGALYIAHWLAHSARLLPKGLRQDVVFLAPAITYEFFAETLARHGSQLGGFRMFAMKDDLERDDQVWGEDTDLPGSEDWRRYLYPSSLLYLVSGILEARASPTGGWVDEPDMPLLGMERFFSSTGTYGDAEFPALQQVRSWLTAAPNRIVWSKALAQPPGLNCDSIDHGAFDDNVATLDSLRDIVQRAL